MESEIFSLHLPLPTGNNDVVVKTRSQILRTSPSERGSFYPSPWIWAGLQLPPIEKDRRDHVCLQG